MSVRRPATMAKPFMIRFPFNGRECYANVYTHDAPIGEYHIHVIGPELHPGLPPRIILVSVDGHILLSEPTDLSEIVLQQVIDGIHKNL